MADKGRILIADDEATFLEAAAAFLIFLETEIEELQNIRRPSIINCTYKELQSYALELGVELDRSYAVLERLCPASR